MEGIQREEASGPWTFHISITSVSLGNQATFPRLPAYCSRKDRVVTPHHLTCRCDSQIWRKKVGKGVYFLHQSLIHSIFFCESKERRPLTVTSLVSLVKIDIQGLDSHSRCLVLYSVLTSTYTFYWLNREVNSSKTELAKSLSAVWLQGVIDTASRRSVLL